MKRPIARRRGCSDSLLCCFRKRTAWLAVALLLVSGDIAQAQENRDHATTSSEAMVLDSVVVTAERIDSYIEKNPQNVVVLGSDEIEQRNLLSVEEALSTMAGVDVKKSSGIGSRISIRGSGKSSGVLVLLNGRPLNSSQYGGADLSSIPIDIVKSITVFKPPLPVWLGAGASQGAIVITTRDSVDKGKDESKRVTRIRAAGGSYGQAEGTVSHRYTNNSGGAMATASGKHRDGKRDNSDRDSGNFTLHWDRELGAGQRFEVDGRYYLAEYGSTGPEDNPTPDARQSYKKGSLDSRLSGIIGATGDYRLNVYGDLIDLRDESQSGLVSDLDNQKYGIKAENTWSDEEERWGFQFTGIVERDDVDHTLSGTHHRNTAGMGVQADLNWDAVSVTMGLRGDYTSDFDVNPGFSGGLRYSLNKHWAIKANAGYTVDIPTFGQLYQPSHGSIDQVRGNPDLDEEKIWSYDLSTEYRKGKSNLFQVSLFRSDTSDPITYERGTDLIYRPVNADRSWRHGVEATWKYGFEFGVTADVNAVVQESEIEETGNELPYTPKVKANLSLLYKLKSTDTRLETTLRYCGKQYSEAQNREDQSIDDYATVDFKVIQPFTIKGVATEWFVNLDNIFDKRYQIHYGYPDDGFRFLAGVNVTF